MSAPSSDDGKGFTIVPCGLGIAYLLNGQISWTGDYARSQPALQRLEGARTVYAQMFGACLFALVDKPGGRILTARCKMAIGG